MSNIAGLKYVNISKKNVNKDLKIDSEFNLQISSLIL